MKKTLFCVLAILVLGTSVQYGKPVLLMGNGYGRYERERWIEKILNEERIDYKTSGTAVPISEWSNYCAVMVADTSPVVISSTDTAQQTAISQYTANGGTVILMEGALMTLINMTNTGTMPSWAQSWVQADVLGRLTSLTPGSYGGADAHFPWPTDMVTELSAPDWSNYFYEVHTFHDVGMVTTHVAIASGTSPTKALVLETDKGTSGHVLMLGRMLFRVEDSTAVNSASYREAIRRTLLNLNPTRVQASNADQVRLDLSPPNEWVTWKRDAEADYELYAYYDVAKYPRFSPPWPVSSEVLSQMSIDMGTGETYARAFNVFPLSDRSNFQVTAVPVNPSSLPSGAVQICKQSAWPLTGTMARHEERFWVKPVASGTGSSIKAADTEIYYVKVNSQNLASGTYALNIQLTDGQTTQTIPLTLRIASVAFPRDKGMKLGLYGLYWANGSLGWDQVSPTTGDLTFVAYTGSASAMAPVLAAEMALGVNSVYGSGPDLTKIKIVKTGQTLYAFSATANHPDFLAIEDPNVPQVPRLDFSAYDAQLAVSQNMGVFRTTFRHGQFKGTSADYIQRLSGEVYVAQSGTQALSDRWKMTFSGIWDQMRWYLRSKGITELNFKYGDELSPTEIEQEWLPVVKLVHAVGWAPEINLTGSAVTGPLVSGTVSNTVTGTTISLIASECRVLTINENYTDLVLYAWTHHQFSLSPYCKLATYGSWGYYKSPGFYNRREWWETFCKNGTSPYKLSGIDVYTFELMNVFDGTTDFLSAAAEGWRAGWNESAYLQKLKALSDQNAANTDPAVVAWRANAQDFFTNCIAPNKANPPTSTYYHGMYWLKIVNDNPAFPDNTQLMATSEQMDLSRKDVLDLIASCPAP